MAKNKSYDPDRPKRLKKIYKEISLIYDDMHNKLSKLSQEAGYAKDLFEYPSSFFENLSDDPILKETEKTLLIHTEFIKDQQSNINNLTSVSIESSAYAVSVSAISTTSTISQEFDNILITPPPSWQPDRRKKYSEKLEKLDPELGEIYNSIWELFYGARNSSERNALFSIRQSFDHFFSILAPDEEVRQSKFFKTKRGENPNQVTREERILYAVNIKIKNKAISKHLSSQSNYFIELYKKLNKLHSRKKLNRNTVKYTLLSMQTILEDQFICRKAMYCVKDLPLS